MSVQLPRPFADIVAEESTQVPEAFDEASQLPYHVAFVIDGVVQQVFHVEERLAALLLSNPTPLLCDSPANGGPDRKWLYDSATGVFTKPE